MKSQKLNEIFDTSNIVLPSSFYNNANIFTQELLSYNKVHNVTGAKDEKSVHENIYDSIYPLQFLKNLPKCAVDIGSGAGFPALILALALPDCHFTLYEPIAKKSAFLHVIKSKMELVNIDIKTKRIEQDTPKITELITSRAVGNTALLIRLSKGFYDKNSVMILYKGSRAEDEVEKLKNARIFERDKRMYVVIKDIENAL